jgi:mannose-1-phosphate guanylyltransferase
MKIVITAGGQGTKLWPLSRENKPKQFQKILGDETLFSYNAKLLLKHFDSIDIVVSTKRKYKKFILEEVPELLEENIICEPDIAKNRGPGEGFTFLKLSLLYPSEPFFFVQVDDLRVPEDKFVQMIQEAEKLVIRDKKFISGGYQVTNPILGNDYLKLGEKIESESKNVSTYSVKEFIWRSSNLRQLQEMLDEDSTICLHANHSCWYPEMMLEAYKEYRPDWYNSLMEMKEYIGGLDEEEKINQIYQNMQAGPTEEVTKHIFEQGYIILLPFEWVDIGTWLSLYKYLEKDGGVVTQGQVVDMNSKHTFVKSTVPNKVVATIGLENIIVVDTPDGLLVANLDKSGEIGDLLKEIKDKGFSDYL